jgi:twitching motility two-component system response regulator PilH
MSKILIIDDLPTEIAIMKSAVASLGHSVITAADGEAGFNAAKAEQPDLILLDVVMPKMDGFQTCRKIKKDPETAEIPVILVTTKNQDTDRSWGLRQGAADFIPKPFNPSELSETVTRTLSARH